MDRIEAVFLLDTIWEYSCKKRKFRIIPVFNFRKFYAILCVNAYIKRGMIWD